MSVTSNEQGVKYRGCLSDCNGCMYQVKAMIGRQHGCWCDDYTNRCPCNSYWHPELHASFLEALDGG